MKKLLITLATAVAVTPTAFVLLLTPVAASEAVTSCGSSGSGPVVDLDDDQAANGRVVVAVGQRMAVPSYGMVVAVATALQESGLRNLRYGDRDSLELFQQRPSQGWGSPAQILDPSYAASQFYAHLLQVPGWERLPVTTAAQAVQRSAFPDAYAQWADEAERVVAALTQPTAGAGTATAVGVAPTVTPCEPAALPPGTAGRVLAFASAQVGDPYVYGATGPDAWDCSSLVRAAFAKAGLALPRTAAEQYDFARARGFVRAGPPDVAALRPGDLLFSRGTIPRAAADGELIGHVAIYAGNGRVLQARGRAWGVTSAVHGPDDFAEFTWVARLAAEPGEEALT